MAEITDIECVDDTCPACESPVSVPKTGAWVECPRVHCRGKLRWKEEQVDVPSHAPQRLIVGAERAHLQRLRDDLAELDHWVSEAVPGAQRIAEQIRKRLAYLTGEDHRVV